MLASTFTKPCDHGRALRWLGAEWATGASGFRCVQELAPAACAKRREIGPKDAGRGFDGASRDRLVVTARGAVNAEGAAIPVACSL